jgi:hypothetical protein
VSGWFSGAVRVRLLDLGAVGRLSVSGYLLVRRRRRCSLLATGLLILGDWSSNLVDRLGMHTVTAPGRARGAVDFIHLGTPDRNVADFIIIGATTGPVVTTCVAERERPQRGSELPRGLDGVPSTGARAAARCCGRPPDHRRSQCGPAGQNGARPLGGILPTAVG